MQRIGPYEVVKELGRGAMGIVYRVRHVSLDREFALKVIHPQTLAARGDPTTLLERFRREAQAAGRAGDHPAIVGVTDVGEFDGQLYVAMELVHGRPLDVVLSEGDFAADEIARWGFELSRALAHAHQAGVLHRDVKPANVLIEVSGHAMLADFGLAAITRPDSDVSRLTQSDELLGTPAYMAPEQITGGALDGRADVYALGATLYEALAGHPPFTGDSIYSILSAATSQDPVRLRHVAPATPAPLERIVHRCLAKNPADRYATADALADDLERFLEGEPVLAPSSVVRQFARSARRNRHWMLLGALLLAAGAGAAAGVVWSAGKERDVADTQTETARHAQAATLAERAGEMAQAWYGCQRDAGAALRRCEDAWNEAAVPSSELDEALARTRAATDRLAAEFPNARAPQAWMLLTLAYAGDDEAMDELAALIAATPDDPFPRLLAARFAFAKYARAVPLPLIRLGHNSILVQEIQVPTSEEPWRAKAGRLVAGLAELPAWRHIPSSDTPLAFVQAAAAMAKGDGVAAEVALAPLIGDSNFGDEALRLSGVARYLRGDYHGAIERWEALAVRGWPRSLLLEAYSRAAAAGADPDADPAATLQRIVQARAAFARLLAIEPLHIDGINGHTMTVWFHGQRLKSAGQDPRPIFREALPPLDRAIDFAPEHAGMRLSRAQLLGAIADEDLERGDDPAEMLQAAERDLQVCLERTPREALVWRRLGLTFAARMRSVPRRSAEARALGAKTHEAFTRAVELAPGQFESWVDLGNLGSYLAGSTNDPQQVGNLLSDGITAVRRGLELQPRDGMARLILGRLLYNRAVTAARRGLDTAADFAASVEAYAGVVEDFPQKSEALRALARTRLSWGLIEFGMRRNGQAHLDQAATDLDQLVERFPERPQSWFARATGRAQLADAAARLRQNPVALRRGALDDFRKTVEGAPGHVVAWRKLAQVASQLAGSPGETPVDAAALHAEALAATRTCLKLAPADATVWLAHGHANWTHWKWKAAAAPPDHAQAELIANCYAKAVQLDPRLQRAVASRQAELRQVLGR